MENFYYKHYITFPPILEGEVAIILDGFSTAFKQPTFGCVCINEQGGYQFKIMPDEEENSPLTDVVTRCHLYRYENGQVRKATDAELTAELTEIEASSPPAAPTLEQQIINLQTQLDAAIIEMYERG